MRAWLGAALLAITALAPAESLDARARHAVQSLRSPALERPMHAISDACERGNLATALLAVALFGGAGGIELAREVVIVLVPVNVVVEITKRVTNRARPDGEHHRSNAAFPSSHAANAFALAVVLARRMRRGAWAFLLIAAVIAFSRLYLDRHWLSDVLAGAVIGGAIAWGIGRALARRRPDAPASPAPPLHSGP
jgi:membrane-associated phospholipid phosphatase